MMERLDIIVLVALAAAFVVLLAKKWGIAEWYQVHGDAFTSRLFSCDLCMSFWASVLVSALFGCFVCHECGREEAGCRRVLASLYWEGPSELPHRRSSSSAPRRDSPEPRPRGCSVLGEPPQALPSF